jgi:hypothetical protein
MDLMRNWSAGVIEGPAGVFSEPCTDLRCYADDLERLRWALDFATGAAETLSDEQVSKLRETRDELADAQRRLDEVEDAVAAGIRRRRVDSYTCRGDRPGGCDECRSDHPEGCECKSCGSSADVVVTSSRGITYTYTGPKATQVTTHALPQAFDSYDY